MNPSDGTPFKVYPNGYPDADAENPESQSLFIDFVGGRTRTSNLGPADVTCF
jgi:hypothetical protein